MKRLVLTHLGGMPFSQEDLKYLQDATKEEIMAVIGAFKNPSDAWMVVSGCIASDAGSGDVAVSDGWVIVGSELGYYAGGTIPDTAGNFPTPEFDTDVLVDAAGTEEYEDGNTHDTYLNTQIILVGSVSALNQAEYIAAINGFPRIQNYFHKAVQEQWIYPSLHADVMDNPSTDYAGTPAAVRYKKTMDNKIELGGTFKQPDTGTPIWPAAIFTLPVGYRPLQKRILSITQAETTGAAIYPRQVLIDTNGDVKIVQSAVANSISLDGVIFSID